MGGVVARACRAVAGTAENDRQTDGLDLRHRAAGLPPLPAAGGTIGRQVEGPEIHSGRLSFRGHGAATPGCKAEDVPRCVSGDDAVRHVLCGHLAVGQRGVVKPCLGEKRPAGLGLLLGAGGLGLGRLRPQRLAFLAERPRGWERLPGVCGPSVVGDGRRLPVLAENGWWRGNVSAGCLHEAPGVQLPGVPGAVADHFGSHAVLFSRLRPVPDG